MSKLRAFPPGLLLLLALLIAGCERHAARVSPPNGSGNAERGAMLIGKYGCGTCHTVPGVAAARGVVGPPLAAMGKRAYIAGVLPNTPDNMVAWLRDPQRVVPGNAMPSMAIDHQDARDLSAYLQQLQ